MAGTNTEDKMTGAEIDFHKRKIEEIWQDLSDFANKLFKFYEAESDRVRELAKHYEALIIAGILSIKVSDISAYIKNHAEELGLDISNRWIERVLDKKYKRNYDTTDTESEHSRIATVAEIPPILQKPIATQDIKELVEAVETGKGLKQLFKDREEEVDERTKERIDELKKRGHDVSKYDRDVIGTPWAKDEENEWADILTKIGNAFVSLGTAAKKVELSPEDAKHYATVGWTWYEILEHAEDVKHTKTMQGWLKTIRTYEDFGKHAAAVKEGITTISGVKRPLTREQVGDKAPEILDAAMRILDMEHLLAVIAEYHRKYVEPRIAERKVNLHDTLSERA